MYANAAQDKVRIVYPFINPKNKSNDGWELRSSIRSLYRNAKFKFDITIIGDIPKWINQDVVTCIELDNSHLDCQRQTRINQKILKASELYDDFLLFNDDIIVMNKTSFKELSKVRSNGRVRFLENNKTFPRNSFKQQIRNTAFKLKENNLQHDVNFCSHTPHYYNSDTIRRVQEVIDLAPIEWPSIVFENAYFGFLGEKGELAKEDRYGVWSETKNHYSGELLLNFDEKGDSANPWLKRLVQNVFDNKCRAEL